MATKGTDTYVGTTIYIRLILFVYPFPCYLYYKSEDVLTNISQTVRELSETKVPTKGTIASNIFRYNHASTALKAPTSVNKFPCASELLKYGSITYINVL